MTLWEDTWIDELRSWPEEDKAAVRVHMKLYEVFGLGKSKRQRTYWAYLDIRDARQAAGIE